MKKIFFALVIVLSGTSGASAQITKGEQTAQPNRQHKPFLLSDFVLQEGQNSMLVKEGQGRLAFTKSGNTFSNITFLDSAGVLHRLSAVPAGTQGAPKPECKYPLPDACFATADKNIGLCICKPSDISGGYNISLIRKVKGNVKYPNITL